MEVEFEDRDCPLGCERADTVLLKGRDYLHGLPGEFQIVRCNHCSLMRTNPRPTQKEIKKYYPDLYRPYFDTIVRQSDTRAINEIIKKTKHMESESPLSNCSKPPRSIPPLKPGVMLEIGCASGSFLHKMSQCGWRVMGIEIAEKAAENARNLGFEIYNGSVETAPEPIEPYDLVVGWMVLEHLHEPVPVLHKIAGWTKPSGWLVLSVPDTKMFWLRIFKDYWYGLHLPNHLYHFTPRTIIHMLENTGWKVERIKWNKSYSNLLQSLRLYAKVHRLKSMQDMLESIIEKRRFQMTGRLLSHFCGLTKTSGRMTIWARRYND